MKNLDFKGIKGKWEVIEIDISDFKQICIASDASKSVLAHVYLPEYKITDELKATANLMANSHELLEALYELISLKKWKDEFGKDEWYSEKQPLAWDNAQKVLEKTLT